MKTLTICGSMRYAEQMKEIAFILESVYAYNVLQCTYGKNELTEAEKENIIKAHYRKIDLSDGVFVVDIDGYIGDSVKQEIEYAKCSNKEIIYHSMFFANQR